MTQTTIVAYEGKGLAAARPASLTLDPGAFGLYWATDTSVLSLWDGSAWQNLAAGGAGVDGHNISSGGTSSDAHAALGYFFTPLVALSITSLGARLNSTTGGVYRFGIAPYNSSTNKMTSAPTYTGNYTESAGAAKRKVALALATPFKCSAGSTYVVFANRTDSTANTNAGPDFSSSDAESLALYTLAANGVTLSSVNPTTADTWSTPGSCFCVDIGYQLT